MINNLYEIDVKPQQKISYSSQSWPKKGHPSPWPNIDPSWWLAVIATDQCASKKIALEDFTQVEMGPSCISFVVVETMDNTSVQRNLQIYSHTSLIVSKLLMYYNVWYILLTNQEVYIMWTSNQIISRDIVFKSQDSMIHW